MEGREKGTEIEDGKSKGVRERGGTFVSYEMIVVCT